MTVEASVEKEGVFTSSSGCFQVRGSLTRPDDTTAVAVLLAGGRRK